MASSSSSSKKNKETGRSRSTATSKRKESKKAKDGETPAEIKAAKASKASRASSKTSSSKSSKASRASKAGASSPTKKKDKHDKDKSKGASASSSSKKEHREHHRSKSRSHGHSHSHSHGHHGHKSKDKSRSRSSKSSKASDAAAASSASSSTARPATPTPASPTAADLLSSDAEMSSPQPRTDPGTDLQSWSEVPSIAHFCSLFRQAFDLLEFDIQELEESLLLMNTEDDPQQLTMRLVIKLLKGCSRTFTNNINEDNYNTYLRRLFLSKREEAEEDNLEYSFECRAMLDEGIDFQDLSLRNRVNILHQLCEFRLEAEDVYDKVKNLDASSLRVEPLGVDSEGVTYWYFYGTRLYKEVVVLKHKKHKERKKKKKEKKEKKKKKKRNHRDSVSSAEEEEPPPPMKKVKQWSVACLTLEDWEKLTAKYKESKKKADKELYETLSVSFLPEIKQMFAEKEREEKRKLLMLQPKRASSRIERKRREQEEKDRELAQKLEEQRRIEEEYDEKLRMERQRREEELKKNAREERIRQRELVIEERAKRAAERGESNSTDEDLPIPKEQSTKTRLRLNATMSDVESEEDEDIYEPPSSTKRNVYESENDEEEEDDDDDDGGLSERSDGSDGVVKSTTSVMGKRTSKGSSSRKSKKSRADKSSFANALLKAGTRSTKDSNLDKLARKTPGRLLETAGRSLLQKSAGSSNPFDMLAATGSGTANAGTGGNKLSFDLYGGHLPVDHGGYTKPLRGDPDIESSTGSGHGGSGEPIKKVFTNWGGEFFKKNLDYRANTNKILEKMNLGGSGASAGSTAASASSSSLGLSSSSAFGHRFGTKTDASSGSGASNGDLTTSSSGSSAVIGGSAAAPLTSFIPGERFKALLGSTSTSPHKRSASSSIDLLAKKTKSSSYFSNY